MPRKGKSVGWPGDNNALEHTFAAAKMSFTDWDISGPMPSPSIKVTVYLPY